MMKNSFIVLLVLFFAMGCKDKYYLEKQYEQCFFKSFSENEKQAKRYIQEYESILISEGLLEGSSELNYHNLMNNLVTGQHVNNAPQYSLIDSLNTLIPQDFTSFNLQCKDRMINAKGYKNSISYKIQSELKEAKDNGVDVELIAENMMALYPVDYFTLDIHKLQVLLILNKTRNYKEIVLKEEIDWENVFSIRLNTEGHIFVKNDKVNIQKMKRLLRQYLTSHQYKSTIVLDVPEDLEMGKFIEVRMNIKKAVDAVRDQVAKSLYGKPYNELSEPRKELVEQQVPYKLINEGGISFL